MDAEAIKKMISAAYFFMDMAENQNQNSQCCKISYYNTTRYFLWQCLPDPDCADLAKTCTAICDWVLRCHHG